MKLSIIIVSYNTKDLLQQCLKSIRDTVKDVDFEVIIVDNGSTDGSEELATIKNRDNRGFAAANNQGIKSSRGDYIMLLNSDTRVKPAAVQRLIDFMDSHPQAGIVAPQLLNPDGSIQPNGGYLPRLSNIIAWMLLIDDLPFVKPWFWSYQLRHLDSFRQARQFGWVQGAVMLLRRSMLDQLGLLDENIFMYGEDVELCYRTKAHGWQVWLCPQAQVIHLGFRSGSSRTAILGEYQNLKYIFSKHKPAWEMPILRLCLKLGASLRLLFFGTILRDSAKYATYSQAFKLA